MQKSKIIALIIFLSLPRFCISQITDSLITPINISHFSAASLEWSNIGKNGVIVRGQTTDESSHTINNSYEIIHFDTSFKEVFHNSFRFKYDINYAPVCSVSESKLFILFPYLWKAEAGLIIYDFVSKKSTQFTFKRAWVDPDELKIKATDNTLYILYHDNFSNSSFIDIILPNETQFINHINLSNENEKIPGLKYEFVAANTTDSVFFYIIPQNHPDKIIYGISGNSIFLKTRIKAHGLETNYEFHPLIIKWENHIYYYQIMYGLKKSPGGGIEFDLIRDDCSNNERLPYLICTFDSLTSLPESAFLQDNWHIFTNRSCSNLNIGQLILFDGAERGSYSRFMRKKRYPKKEKLIFIDKNYSDTTLMNTFKVNELSNDTFYRFFSGSVSPGHFKGYCIGNKGVVMYNIDSTGSIIETRKINTGLQNWDINQKIKTPLAGSVTPANWIPFVDAFYAYENYGIIIGSKGSGTKGNPQILYMYKFVL